MRVRPFFYGVAAIELIACAAMASSVIITGPPCRDETRSYLLALNAGAVISVEEEETGGSAVVVYRPRQEKGWASQRLLSRFDLAAELDDRPVVIRNSGATCARRN